MCWKDIFPKENRYFETENGILYCCDCLEVLKKFPEESVDLVLTDPPYGVRKKKYNHPTTKPLGLMEDLIYFYSNRGDLVLDPFIGSGTTLVACEKLNRRWIGIEINPDYCEIAKRRILALKDEKK